MVNVNADLIKTILNGFKLQLKETELAVRHQQGILESENTVVFTSNLDSSAGFKSYLNIIERVGGDVKYNFTSRVYTTPRYTEEQAMAIVAEVNSKHSLQVECGTFIACATQDIQNLNVTIEDTENTILNMQ